MRSPGVESGSNARLETAASQFEDVVSRVVVYSSEQAEPLRSLATRIATRQNLLDHCDNEVF